MPSFPYPRDRAPLARPLKTRAAYGAEPENIIQKRAGNVLIYDEEVVRGKRGVRA